MAAKIVRQYITQDFSFNEKKSYLAYINGDTQSTDWVEKGLFRREPLLLKGLTCSTCGNWVNIRENGICNCSRGHKCYNVVIQEIERIRIRTR